MQEHLGSCCGVMEATTRVRAAPSVADTDGNMMSGSSSALKPKPPPQDGALHPPSNFRSGAGTPGLDRDPQSLRAKPGSFRESGGMPDEGFQAVGSRLRAIRKRDRQDDLEPPSFSLGIGEASEMPSFDLGIDSEGEPDDLGARGLRGSKVPQRPGAVENRGTGGLGGQKGGEGEMGSGWGWGEGLGRHEELQHGEVPARASKESARPDQRALRAEGKQSTPDRVPLEAAAKSRNRLRKVSSGAPEREATGSKTPTPSLLAKATAAVARSPDEIAGAFADSDEEDQALLSIDFRSAGKSRASNGLTPIRKRGSESSQGLGLGGWKGAARESLGRGGVDRAKAAQTPEELEVRGSKDQITEEGSQRKQLDSALHRGNGKFASEIEKEVSGPKRSRGGAGVALDGLRTPPSGLMQKRNRLQKSPVVKRTHVDLSEGPEVPEGLANRSSGLDSRASLGASVEEKEGRRGQTKFAGRDFVPDSEDDEIEDVSSPEGKKASGETTSVSLLLVFSGSYLVRDLCCLFCLRCPLLLN